VSSAISTFLVSLSSPSLGSFRPSLDSFSFFCDFDCLSFLSSSGSLPAGFAYNKCTQTTKCKHMNEYSADNQIALVHIFIPSLHCKDIWIYVFPEKELRGLSQISTFMCVSDQYIPRLAHIFSCSRLGRPIRGIYKSLTETWMYGLGL